MKDARLFPERSYARDTIDFYFIEHRADERWAPYLCTNMEFEKQEEGFRPTQATFSLRSSEAQELFDNLWRVGLRPSEIKDEGPAMKRHLEDMRAIAFSKLKVELPPR